MSHPTMLGYQQLGEVGAWGPLKIEGTLKRGGGIIILQGVIKSGTLTSERIKKIIYVLRPTSAT